MLTFEKSKFIEYDYILTEMPKAASLFTTGNGYMGVRGSHEEFGETRIQGAFVRGLFDEIVEIVEPFPDNTYMKKYYFDEEKLKRFEKQDSCINFPDFLLIRFTIGGKVFLPWDGKIVSWKRYLDTKTGVLTREVVWDDGEGNQTRFTFERFASYANKHLYVQRATCQPINHSLPVTVISGVDSVVRTNGQIITKKISSQLSSEGVKYEFLVGEKYGYTATISTSSHFYADGKKVEAKGEECNDLYVQKAEFPTVKRYVVEKESFIFTSRDREEENVFALGNVDYEGAFKAHFSAYTKQFDKIDVQIEGDDKLDNALRFANYHTLISADLDESVHSLSAKALSGEKYNQFVWWDCEIYQTPIFTHTIPEVTKNALEYRYRMLPAARELAKKQGMKKGARYPFVSSVDGDEHVWIYARHPFLQIHIMSDIAYCIFDYLDNTMDTQFMNEKGIEMLAEISRWWLQRVTKTERGYEILNVTGTDEHHDYVDNDAYTNYITAYVLKRTAEYIKEHADEVADTLARIAFTEEERKEMLTVGEEMYLPMEESGMIPQFDGYFSLSRTLEVEGSGTGKNFQMKQAGLYHTSQVIKQPDVMLLYSYVDVGELPEEAGNWDYYEGMCESSSSLTFPVHAICSARNGRMNSFLKYFTETLFMDIIDIHHCAWQGMHAGCAAGGWYAVFRGIMGITVRNGEVKINPKKMPFWKSVSLTFQVKDATIKAVQTVEGLTLTKISGEDVTLLANGEKITLSDTYTLKF